MPRRSRKTHSLVSVVTLLIGLSIFEYAEQGRVVWPSKLYYAARDMVAQLQPPAVPGGGAAGGMTGWVSKVTDGDTFTLNATGLEPRAVRLYGIDAPERDQAHGQVATTALAAWIDGREVSVVVDDVDNYGRLVGTVFIGERNINLAMVQQGHAWWYQQYSRDAFELELAEQQARAARLGLWANGTAVEPWEWRQR
jgi:endonuclease YncB( thermonuclease family)